MTSIHDIPSEILSHIFLFYYASSREKFTTIKTTLEDLAIPTPFNTTSICVCRHWRDVAHDTPQLWEYIPLHLPAEDVQRRLKRSKGYSIHIHSDLSFNFASAITHAARWKTLHLSAGFLTPHHPLLRDLCLPELEHLVVAWGNNVNDVLTGFKTPRLQTAAFIETSPHIHQFSLTNLTALLIDSLNQYPFHELRPALASIVALQTLVVRHTILRPLDPAFEPITIPTLRTLEIDLGTVLDRDFAKDLCMAIRAPNLENLHLVELNYAETYSLLSSITASTFSRLRFLRLALFNGTSSRSTHLLQAFPAVTHLALGGDGLFDDMERLTQHINVLPEVDTLTLDCLVHRDPRDTISDAKDCSLEQFARILALVEARTQIKKLRFDHGCVAAHPLKMEYFGSLLIERRPPHEYESWP